MSDAGKIHWKPMFPFRILDSGSVIDETNTNADYQNTNHRFDILYTRRHAWHGYMDYISTLPDQGLQEFMIKPDYKPFANLFNRTDDHYLMLAAVNLDIYDMGRITSKQLVHEIDFVLK